MMPDEPTETKDPKDEVVTNGDEPILDDEEESPSSLDREALTDDAC